ncbi:MAG: transcription antitermination factor NusB [Promethearchaeota archaeon]
MDAKSDQREISREEAAADVLILWEEKYPSLRSALRHFSKVQNIKDWHIRTAIHGLVFETIRRLNTIDWALNFVLKKTNLDELDNLTRNVLRTATYLILFGNAKAPLVTNEAVTIVKRRNNKKIAGFCNAVLRKIQALNLEELYSSFSVDKQTTLRNSVPLWLLKEIKQILGPDETRKFLESVLENPSVYVRVNTLLCPVKKAVRDLENEGFKCTPSPRLSEMLKLQRGTKPVTHTQSYQENKIYLQSLSSALVSRVANPPSSAIIIDLCAAPGSKTSHLAQIMGNKGNIIAIDNAPLRVKELQRNLHRLDVRNTHTILANSFKLPLCKNFNSEYVLVDPPCSNTGVIQTRPEAKWNMNPKLIRKIRRVQKALLEVGSFLVASSGYLIYSTCSITLDENENLIHDFLSSQPGFELVKTDPWIGQAAFKGLDKCQRLFPHRDDTEGFFVAKLHRQGNKT